MTDCLFCKIRDGEIPGDIVYENDHVLAFNDINPVAPTHILIIPKEHISTLNDLEENHGNGLTNGNGRGQCLLSNNMS